MLRVVVLKEQIGAAVIVCVFTWDAIGVVHRVLKVYLLLCSRGKPLHGLTWSGVVVDHLDTAVPKIPSTRHAHTDI